MLHMSSCTYHDVTRLRAKYLPMNVVQNLQSFFVFEPSSCSGLQTLDLNLTFHKFVQEKIERSQVWRLARKSRVPRLGRCWPRKYLIKNIVISFVVVSFCVLSQQINPQTLPEGVSFVHFITVGPSTACSDTAFFLSLPNTPILLGLIVVQQLFLFNLVVGY